MKCIFQFWSATPHLETSFEIAIKETLAGEVIEYYWGGDDVLFNEDNRPGRLGLLFCSQKPIIRALTLVKKHFGEIFKFHSGWVRYDKWSEIRAISECNSIDDILNLRVDDFLVGRAAVSSLMQVMQADLMRSKLDSIAPLLQEIIDSGLAVYFSAKNIIAQAGVEEVIFFNGRFIHEAAILAACRAVKVPYRIHERGATPEKYWLVDYLAHDAEASYREAQNLWDYDRSQGIPVEAQAREYIEARINDGYGGAWISHTHHFDRRSDFDVLKKQIGISTPYVWVFFQSSNDEYACIDPSLVKPTEWSRQEDIVNFLAESLPVDVTLIVRIHPNMRNKNKHDLGFWRILEEQITARNLNVKFVWESAEINSYLLAENAKLVISCGSTIGAEAIYLGSPSICCGSSVWGFAEGALQVFDYVDLKKSVIEPTVPDASSILPVFYWWATRGIDFEYFDAKGLFAGAFLGQDLFNDPKYIT